jgi:deoxyribonuclease-4
MNDIIGSHVSFTKEKQLLGSVMESIKYSSKTFMIYTGAPQNTKRIPIDNELTVLAHNLMDKENININNIVVHAPYIINLANPNNIEFNISFLKEEIRRVESLGISKLVIHPGSHIGLGLETGIKNVIKALNSVIREDQKVIICLETMAGKGTEIGSTFEELEAIIDGIIFNDKIAVCLDTCHVHDSGYDLSDFNKVLDNFDNIIGLNRLLVIHINDSKNETGTHKDRHENIGIGKIGFDILVKVVFNKRVKDVPKILETPYIDNEYPPYKHEIEMLRNNSFNKNIIEEIICHYRDYKSK